MSWRPWTQSAKRIRQLKGLKRKPPEPIKKWNILNGDKVRCWETCLTVVGILNNAPPNLIFQVQILVGRDKGKQGTVGTVDRKHHRVFVKGMNTVS